MGDTAEEEPSQRSGTLVCGVGLRSQPESTIMRERAVISEALVEGRRADGEQNGAPVAHQTHMQNRSSIANVLKYHTNIILTFRGAISQG